MKDHITSPSPTSPRPQLWDDCLTVVRGVCMGGADVIPGVSGGTVALILGIYARLVAAISHFDRTFVSRVARRQWRAASAHVDLRFLVALGGGILSGIVLLGSVMNHLLTDEHTRPLTLAAFFGMILASSVLVARTIRATSVGPAIAYFALGVGGAVFAHWLTGVPTTSIEPSYGYVFGCGMVAICAMILPGISGAYILLILGVYIYLTDIIKALPRGQITAEMLITVAVFATGCAIGLISFSKVLRWLLDRHHNPTMAVLCGFMIGALGKVWPFQNDVKPLVEDVKHKQFENYWPSAVDGQVLLAAAVGVGAMILVFVIDWFARRTTTCVPSNPTTTCSNKTVGVCK